MKQMKKKSAMKVTIIISIIFVISFVVSQFMSFGDKTEELTYNDFIQMVENKEVDNIQINLNNDTFLVEDNNGKTYITDNPKYSNFKKDMLEQGIEVSEYKTVNYFDKLVNILFLIIPISVLLSFKSKTKVEVMTEKEATKKSTINFSDVAGLKPVKKDLEQIVDFLKEPKKYQEKGVELPKGAILYGDPGTGKTLIAKAIAGEANVPFFSVSGSGFIEMFAGVGAKRVRELFAKARENAPCILFIDEIDAIGGKRSGYQNSEARQTLNQLLTELDGFNSLDGVFVICATNRLEDLDSALIRPGRFEKHICVPVPSTKEERLEVIKLYTKNKKIDETVDLENLAKETIGFSPADIKSLINEATLISIQDGKELVDKESFNKAVFKKLLKGHPKEGTDRDKDEMKLVAWHEAGHAVLGKLYNMDISKVTITPSTSGAGGVNIIVPKKMGLYTVEEFENRIKMSYGGRCAEFLLFGDKNKITTGASGDIQNATQNIHQMVTTYGMNEKYGMINLSQLQVDNKVILDEVVKISKRLEEEALNVLRENIDFLQAVAETLLEKETITGEELTKIYEKVKVCR
mgnify:CR=1 FL=1